MNKKSQVLTAIADAMDACMSERVEALSRLMELEVEPSDDAEAIDKKLDRLGEALVALNTAYDKLLFV